MESSTNHNLVPGGTERWDLFAGSAGNGGGSTEAGAGPTVALDWSWAAADKWAIGGVSIKPGAGGTQTISGTTYHDVDGDADVAEGGTLTFSGATVRLFLDDGDGVIDAGDTLQATATTNASGQYTFTGLADATYWVAVDSTTLTSGAAYNAGFDSSWIWAEQTYGDDSGTVALDLAARYGGRDANASDAAVAASPVGSEHVSRVVVAGASVSGVDSGFSFNAVVTSDDGDDVAGNRTVQGSLRQFLLNANAITNASFGTQSSNFSIGSGAQTIALTSALPNITDAVVLNATTQEGFVATPLIQVSGGGTVATAFNIQAGGSGSTIRGFVVNGFTADAIDLTGDNNLIAGDWIGTDATGNAAAAVRNAEAGIIIRSGSDNNTIGGTTAADRNVIAGNGVGANASDNGITVRGSSNVVQGNYIGVAVDGTTVIGNGDDGVDIGTGATNNVIGGIGAGQGNLVAGSVGVGVKTQGDASGTTIAGNTIYSNSRGVRVQNTATGTTISQNSIFGNAGVGIDLNSDGVTPNDAGDVDIGPNALQNYPVLTSAQTDAATQITIVGSLNSTASTTFRIEFFSNPAADPSGHGEGETYLGFVDVTTDGAGNAAISTTLSANVPVGASITATATDLTTSNTSEFAANIASTSTNAAPVNSVPGPRVATEDTAFAFTGASLISVADANGNLATVALSVTNGTLNVTLAGGA
ncbi:MAG: hypothetical protein L0221_16400, partial [Chloroflexi bacterium]|nr:hypothetical protein [Chloroflexota bacterium]